MIQSIGTLRVCDCDEFNIYHLLAMINRSNVGLLAKKIIIIIKPLDQPKCLDHTNFWELLGLDIY